MILSILIPSLPESANYLARLQAILAPQLNDNVEVIVDSRGREVPTGTKRNDLIARSTGEYFVQIDCDDVVPGYYVSELLKAIELRPDVITFIGHMLTNGAHRREFTIKLGERYEERHGQYFRFPNHLCCFKRSVVSHVKFPQQWIQEDYLWAKAIHDNKLLKTEIHIQKDMYTYEYITKPHVPRARIR